MDQRRALMHEVDEEMRRYINGESIFGEVIERVLESSDELTRQLVFFRVAGGDYRQATLTFHISETTYYARLRNFRRALITAITPPKE